MENQLYSLLQGPFHTTGGLEGGRVHNISFSNPLVIDSVRLILHAWSDSPPCLSLQLYGCISSEVEKPTGRDNTDMAHLAVAIGTPLGIAVTALTAVTIAVLGVYCRRARWRYIAT